MNTNAEGTTPARGGAGDAGVVTARGDGVVAAVTAPTGRPTTCDQATWDPLLKPPYVNAGTLTWMVRQAAGWPDYYFADRGDLWRTLLGSSHPLTSSHLCYLAGNDGSPPVLGVRQLLARPSRTFA